jgi:hypothetical protein
MIARFDNPSVNVERDEIVVSRSGTLFLIAFKKSSNQRQLVVTRSWLANLNTKPLLEFRAQAAQAAVAKARALGCIVDACFAVDQKNSSPERVGQRRHNHDKCTTQ